MKQQKEAELEHALAECADMRKALAHEKSELLAKQIAFAEQEGALKEKLKSVESDQKQTADAISFSERLSNLEEAESRMRRMEQDLMVKTKKQFHWERSWRLPKQHRRRQKKKGMQQNEIGSGLRWNVEMLRNRGMSCEDENNLSPEASWQVRVLARLGANYQKLNLP